MWKPLPGPFHSPVQHVFYPGACDACVHVCVRMNDGRIYAPFHYLFMSSTVILGIVPHHFTQPPGSLFTGWKMFSSHFIYWTRQQQFNVWLKEAPFHIYAHDKKLLPSCINATICNELWFRRADIFARSTITSPTCEQTVFPHFNWLESISSTGASSRRF